MTPRDNTALMQQPASNEVTVVPVGNEEYAMICRWWQAHYWPILSRESLPKTGFVSLVDRKPIIAGFLYSMDADIGWLAWIVSDPESSNDERTAGMKALMDAIKKAAKEKGMKSIFTPSNYPSLIQRLVDNGFYRMDEGVVHLLASV